MPLILKENSKGMIATIKKKKFLVHRGGIPQGGQKISWYVFHFAYFGTVHNNNNNNNKKFLYTNSPPPLVKITNRSLRKEMIIWTKSFDWSGGAGYNYGGLKNKNVVI